MTEFTPYSEINDQKRDKSIRSAHAWITNAGLYCADAEEVIDDLFERGVLRPWRHDAALQAEMVNHWQRMRPLGIEAEVRAEAYQRHLRPRKVLSSKADARPAPAADRDPPPVPGADGA